MQTCLSAESHEGKARLTTALNSTVAFLEGPDANGSSPARHLMISEGWWGPRVVFLERAPTARLGGLEGHCRTWPGCGRRGTAQG
jgi:hypothetical protein